MNNKTLIILTIAFTVISLAAYVSELYEYGDIFNLLAVIGAGVAMYRLWKLS